MGLGSLFGKLFGGGEKQSQAANSEPAVEYKGFMITAAPAKQGNQYRTGGSIAKEIDGEQRTVQFIRADNHSDRDSAVSHSERKAQQIIDEQGDAMFLREVV